MMLFRAQMTEFHMHNSITIHPFCPLYHTPLVSVSYRSLTSQATPFTDEACKSTIVRLEKRKVVRRKTWEEYCSHPRKFQHVTWLCALGPCIRAHAIVAVVWQRGRLLRSDHKASNCMPLAGVLVHTLTSVAFLLCVWHVKFKRCLQFEVCS